MTLFSGLLGTVAIQDYLGQQALNTYAANYASPAPSAAALSSYQAQVDYHKALLSAQALMNAANLGHTVTKSKFDPEWLKRYEHERAKAIEARTVTYT